MTHPLRPLFEPRSVAVIGASSNPAKRGHQVVAALRRSGYAGAVHPVHPDGGELLGLPVARSVAEIDPVPELVYVARAAASVTDAVRACGEAGVRGAIVPAVGFRESGEEGARLERELFDAARATGIRVVGPNTSGILNTHTGLHMVGGEPLPPGAIAVLAQSGNVALDLMTAASSRPVGLSIYVGPGNEVDVGFHELLDYLGQHEPTRAIVVYVEGVRDGRALIETAASVSAAKPIIVLKGGRSGAGGRAALSHTGAVAGSYAVFRALARQSGMIEVTRSDALLPVAEALATQPAPVLAPAVASEGGGVVARGLVVISDGGGHATLAADQLSEAGVPLALLSDATRTALRELLGPAASTRNPVDVAGAADRAPGVLARTVELAIRDPACAGVLVSGLFGGYAIRFATSLAAAELETADALAAAAREAGIPLVVHTLYAARRPEPLARLLSLGVPVQGSLETAVACVHGLWRRAGGSSPGRAAAAARAPAARAAETVPAAQAVYAAETVQAGDAARAPDAARRGPTGSWLSELETRELVGAYGVPLVPAELCRSENEIRALPASDGAQVLKIVSRALPHKTEAGAVRTGLVGAEALVSAYRDCRDSAARYLAAADHLIEGALVSPHLPEPIAEMLIGVRRDAEYGPILTLGSGGVEVELGADVSIRGFPLTAEDIEDMCRELARGALLFGYRGRPAADVGALGAAAMALGNCLLDHPDIAELELNPTFVYADRVVAVDASGRRVG